MLVREPWQEFDSNQIPSNCNSKNLSATPLNPLRPALPTAPIQDDTVNHPQHYTAGKYEVIDIIDSILESMPSLTAKEGSRLANIIKYLARFKNKNGVEDLKKARWYLDKLIAENTPPTPDRESDGWVC